MSVARTRNVCGPTPSSVYSTGVVHGAKGSLSSAHSKVCASGSLAVKLKPASTSVVCASGPLRIVVTGAVRSACTVHIQLAGVSSTLPAASVARAASVCAPSARFVNSVGSGQAVKPAPSSEHSKVDVGSSLWIANTAVVLSLGTFGSGPKTIVVSGGSSSVTVQE